MNLPRKAGIGGMMFLATLLAFTGCSRHTDPFEEVKGDGPKVLVSFPPLYCFVKGVAGDNARVVCLLTTQEPHDYSPSAADAIKVKYAEMLVINGLGLDDRFIALKNSSGNSKLKLIDLGEELEEHHHDLLRHMNEGGESGHKDGHGHSHGGDHDPHAWLGIDQAKEMVKIIAKQLSEVAPEHKAVYQKNAESYVKKLEELHKEGLAKLAGTEKKRIVATHDSMGYFADSFKLKVVDSLMPQPGIKPDGEKMEKLIKLCTDKDEPVRVITVEPQYGDQAAKVLLAEVKNDLTKRKLSQDFAPVLVTFDTMETATADFPLDLYFIKMRENIDNLAKALK